MAAGTRINDRDLRQLQAAFNALRTRLPEAGTQVLEDTAHDVSKRAAGAVMSRPGSSGRYKRDPDAYDWTASRNGHPAVEISGSSPTAVGAEFGATYHTVFGRRVAAKSMKRRVFGARVKRALSGKVVGRTTKAMLPKVERDLAIAFDRTSEREFTKRGL